MTSFTRPNRRQFLGGVSAGSAGLLAGCIADIEAPQGTADDGQYHVGLVLQPGEEVQDSIEDDLMDEIEAGEMDQVEAQEAFRRRVGAVAVEELETALEQLPLTIEDAHPDLGAVTVRGDAGDILDSLTIDIIQAIIPADQLAPEATGAP